MNKKHYGSEKRAERIQWEPCVICTNTPCVNAHVKSRGAGGTWENIVPLCFPHHQEQHQIGIKTFQEKYGVDLTLIAKCYAEDIPEGG